MSAIEETLQRIEHQKGVKGFVIVDDDGNVLRYKRDMQEEDARVLAREVYALTKRAVHTVRDMDPKDNLTFLRLRMKHLEVLASPGPGFLIVVIQQWTPTADPAAEEA